MYSYNTEMKVQGNYKLLETPQGRSMVCATDAKAGDLILDEEAFAICPETTFLMNKYVSLLLYI